VSLLSWLKIEDKEEICLLWKQLTVSIVIISLTEAYHCYEIHATTRSAGFNYKAHDTPLCRVSTESDNLWLQHDLTILNTQCCHVPFLQYLWALAETAATTGACKVVTWLLVCSHWHCTQQQVLWLPWNLATEKPKKMLKIFQFRVWMPSTIMYFTASGFQSLRSLCSPIVHCSLHL